MTATYASRRARSRVVSNVFFPSGAVVAAVATGALRSGALAVVLALLVALLALAVWRGASIRVDADDEALTVRNLLATRRLRWDEIDRFDRRRTTLASARWRETVCAVAVTTDGRRVTLLAMPVEEWWRGQPPRRFKAAAVVEGWEAALAARG